jgi:hypothetical protein
VATVIPFALSHSADEQSGDPSVDFSASRRRASGHAELGGEGLQLTLSEAVSRTVVVPYAAIASAVFSPGLLRNRLRLTARSIATFAALSPRVPGELTLILGRRHREDARAFVAALRVRMAEAVTPPGAS